MSLTIRVRSKNVEFDQPSRERVRHLEDLTMNLHWQIEAPAWQEPAAVDGPTISTIVFDLGGVLFTEGKSVALDVLSRDYGYDAEVVWDILTCKASRDMRKGLVSESAFWLWVGGWIPRDYDARVIRDEWYKGYALDREIFDLVKALKSHYRIAVFSENIRDRVAYLEEKYRFREHFDVEVYSYDHHLGKRDPAFLEVLLSTLDERPIEILYIDNSWEVLEMAEQRGLNVIHYTTGQIRRVRAVMQLLGIPGHGWAGSGCSAAAAAVPVGTAARE